MTFKVMEWIRRIRDEDYKKHKKLTPREKVEHTRKVAEKFSKKALKKEVL